MKHILKKLSILFMTVTLAFGSSAVVFATETSSMLSNDENVSVNQLLESVPIPYAGVVYEYANDQIYGTDIKEFTANASGKLRLGFAAGGYDGSKNETITITLEVKNILGHWAPQITYSFKADGSMNVRTPNVNIYNGDQCRLIVRTSSSNKRMVVAGYVGVY